jgi:guanosine-3',5'-bis(diphosphate) 3'-pyrophosphohydrolase
MFNSEEISLFLAALRFSAEKHCHQRRKDQAGSPYINHPIQVAETLWRIGQVHDIVTITAALLHDTLEDTPATPTEIEALFGTEVLVLVQEVTDDKTLAKEQRKRLQIEQAAKKSRRAKQIKLADKSCNVYDVTHHPPYHWSLERRQAYLAWTEQVVAGLRGVNAALEAYYDTVLHQAKNALAAQQVIRKY